MTILRPLLLFLNAALLLVAITSLMVFFTGGRTGQGGMVLMLMLGFPFSALVFLGGLAVAWRQAGRGNFKRQLTGNIPNWLKFGIALALALLFCGELALLLTHPLGAEQPPRYMYLPVLTGTLAIMAYAIVFALGGNRTHSGGHSKRSMNS